MEERGPDLLDAPGAHAVGRLSSDTWQQLAVLLPAERQVPARLGRQGRQKDRLVEDGPQAGL